jgi:hypothetical protein
MKLDDPLLRVEYLVPARRGHIAYEYPASRSLCRVSPRRSFATCVYTTHPNTFRCPRYVFPLFISPLVWLLGHCTSVAIYCVRSQLSKRHCPHRAVGSSVTESIALTVLVNVRFKGSATPFCSSVINALRQLQLHSQRLGADAEA